MTYIIALTGGIGSGKSTVSNAFAHQGLAVVDADVIARHVVKPGTIALTKISAYFGNQILLASGSLNRIALRQRIFSFPEDKIWLNQLLHPLIVQESQRQLAAANSSYALWVVPLLVENSLQSLANRVLVIDVNINAQLVRTMARDAISCQQVHDILVTQATREKRLTIADDIIDNNVSVIEVKKSVDVLHQRYLKLAALAPK
ncbi:dephospho-CoA kinase [Candidatus Gillettellia adelgis]